MRWTTLSSREALSKLYVDAMREVDIERRRLIAECPSISDVGPIRWLAQAHACISSSSYCLVYSICLIICAALMPVGALQHEFTIIEALPPLMMAVLILLNVNLADLIVKRRQFEVLNRADEVVNWLRTVAQSKSLSLRYPSTTQPDSECISLQLTIRDGREVNVPWMLLAKGDVILIRPGHCAPCRCICYSGSVLCAGEKIPHVTTNCPDTDAVIPLVPRECAVLEAPLIQHLRDAFMDHRKRRTTLLDVEIRKTMHWAVEHFLLPFAAFATLFLLVMRHWLLFDFTESWLHSVGVFAITLMPLLGPTFPLLCFIIKYWNLACVLGRGRFLGERDFSAYYHTSLSIFAQNPHRPYSTSHLLKSFFAAVSDKMDNLCASSDIVFNLGGLSTAAFIDKKGILSWPNATAEKVFFFRKHVSQGGEVKIVPEILDLTLKRDQPFAVRFDDPNWRQYRSCLMPLAENALVNSCILQGLHTRMLDHMLAISERTPRTVAVPNHRCLCYLARLIGLEECALRRFSLTTTKTLGVYKRDCGEVPLPGSSKRRTALENAFLTVTRDAQTLHHHVMSQGTADLLLSACSHVWAGDAVEPLTRVARKRVVDFCQRHCMTGYCSVMTYKTCGCNLSEQMSRRYIDLYFSFGRVSDSHAPVALPRSLSIDAASLPYFYSELPLHNTEQCLNVLLKDQVFCGVVVMQYQAREDVVHLIEQLDNACVRFVYFSKENELRSRVFAEKLGLEAGWNCHISLASKGSDEWEREQFERSMQDSKRNCSSAFESGFARRGSSQWDVLLAPKPTRRPNRFSSIPVISLSDSHVPRRTDSKYAFMSGETTLSDADHAQKPGTIDSPSQYAAVKSDSCFKDSPSKPSLMSWSDEVAPMVLPNKAQLPSGIENIRPHLQNVDNVPLLVNLFSDSDHHTSREMIEIMQDNGEVVLVVGSSLNYHNGRIFSKGNCSICIEPQRPAVCCYELNKAVTSNLQATHLASRLMGICTNIILPSDVSLDLIALISECRYRLRLSRSAMSFFLQSSFSLYLLQFFSLFPFAPSMLTAFQMFLLACVYVPVVTFAITALGGQGNDCIDQISQKNTGDVAWKAMRRMSISVLVVYLPNVSFVAVVYVALVMTGTTTLKTSSTNSIISWSPDDVVHTARHVAAFLYTVLLCVISAQFVYVRHNAWNRCPLRNKAWVIACVVTIVLQAAYTAFALESFALLREYCSPIFLLTAVIWVMLAFTINELYKLRQIKLYARDQRRRKLCFNTKLGMNSPY